MTKKPSIADPEPKPANQAAQPASAQTAEVRAEKSDSQRANRQPDGRKGILVRARPEAWKALKIVALDGERTLQDVMTEAINDVLSKHGKPPVA
ncbi:MAG: hypothetical protein MIN69_25190 [Methylorubrum extorquens]|uniref:ribbon-helix-helix domain-containing protein n=1 Tax=Methylorubrum extorquens TaxID=408 RepID=UPI002FEE2412